MSGLENLHSTSHLPLLQGLKQLQAGLQVLSAVLPFSGCLCLALPGIRNPAGSRNHRTGRKLLVTVLALFLFFQPDRVDLGVPEHQIGGAAGIGNC